MVVINNNTLERLIWPPDLREMAGECEWRWGKLGGALEQWARFYPA